MASVRRTLSRLFKSQSKEKARSYTKSLQSKPTAKMSFKGICPKTDTMCFLSSCYHGTATICKMQDYELLDELKKNKEALRLAHEFIMTIGTEPKMEGTAVTNFIDRRKSNEALRAYQRYTYSNNMYEDDGYTLKK